MDASIKQLYARMTGWVESMQLSHHKITLPEIITLLEAQWRLTDQLGVCANHSGLGDILEEKLKALSVITGSVIDSIDNENNIIAASFDGDKFTVTDKSGKQYQFKNLIDKDKIHGEE